MTSSEITASRAVTRPHGKIGGYGITHGRIIGAGLMLELSGVDDDLTAEQVYERLETIVRQNLAAIVTVNAR